MKTVRPVGRLKSLILLAAVLLAADVPAACAQGGDPWVATWTASPTAPFGDSAPTELRDSRIDNQTVRNIVHTSIGGGKVRIKLSNLFGARPLAIGAAHVAIREKGSSIVPSSDRALTFSGRPSVSIPAGALALSDPVRLDVPASADLAVSIYLPEATLPTAIHRSAFQTSYVAAGNVVGAATMTAASTISTWPFLVAVDVAASEGVGAIVTLGDSITDGANSTGDTNRRWPDVLAARLLAAKKNIAVANQGIGGNRILHDGAGDYGPAFGPSALARFDRDVLAQAGVKYVIVLLGINDIGHPGSGAPLSEDVTAEDLIAGLRQIAERAHEKGLRIFGATLTPFEGTTFPGYYSPEKETKRQAVNQWIRTGGAFDGVIDFDKAVRDPSRPSRMLPAYDAGDHLHPNDAGMKAMGESIDLGLFR